MGQRMVTSASWMYKTSMGCPGPESRMKSPVSSSSPLIVLKDLTFTISTLGIHKDLEREISLVDIVLRCRYDASYLLKRVSTAFQPRVASSCDLFLLSRGSVHRSTM